MYTMNRCFPRHGLTRALLNATAAFLILITGSVALSANAQTPQQRIPPMAAKALRGVLVVTQPPEILLNDQPARLSPGARIRGRNNLLVLSGALVGQPLQVRYLLDTSGLVHEVWILTDAELQDTQ
jgi:hypothetical protein